MWRGRVSRGSVQLSWTKCEEEGVVSCLNCEKVLFVCILYPPLSILYFGKNEVGEREEYERLSIFDSS